MSPGRGDGKGLPGRALSASSASLGEQRLHRFAQPPGNPHGLPRQPVDEDMHKIADRGWLLIVLFEDADLIAHAGITQLPHAQASINDIGKLNRLEKLAMRLDSEADLVAAAEVQPAGFHQIAVDDGIEEFVVDDIVDVVVDIIVAPARWERAAVAIVFAAFLLWVQRHRTC